MNMKRFGRRWALVKMLIQLVCGVVGVTMAEMGTKAPTAHAYTLPVAGGYAVTNGFWECRRSCYHLGDDVVASEGAEVRSICSGTVVEVTFRTTGGNYGGRVLVQCMTSDGPIVALYGHLGEPTTSPMTNDIFVSVGNSVNEGQVLGRIGGRHENGGFDPHLHLGIHRGPYQGSATECGRWTYAGYTAEAYDPDDLCYCDVMNNWHDPSEFLGVRPRSLRVTSGMVSPERGAPQNTSFVWTMNAQGGRGLPLYGTVYIWNPVHNREYEFPMDYGSSPTEFQHVGQLQNSGTYTYRFKVDTCAEENEETMSHPGPVVSLPMMGCTPSPEICDGADNDCDGQRDEGVTIACQSACGSGVQVCDVGRFLPCTAPQPQTEVCNSRDDDCDSAIDEGLSRACNNSCGAGVQSCSNGAWGTCSAPTPSAEVCDGRDNNCNGQVDEGLSRTCTNTCGNTGTETCSTGQWGACTATVCPPPCMPVPETCNARDDDCDGEVDERLTRVCGSSCGSGMQVCSSGTWSVCSAPNPAAEVCDGRDNNCNGQVDESLTRACSSSCGSGTETCSSGTWHSCSAPQPTIETCNGRDDDCDGSVDEQLRRACSNSCGNVGEEICARGAWGTCSAATCPPICTPVPERCDNQDNDCDQQVDEGLTRACNNSCGSGTETCAAGNWNGCTAPQPGQETCNGRDDDCDGQTDEQLTRACSNTCGNTGTETCTSGSWGTCSAAACGPICIPTTEVCDGVDNNCNNQVDENLQRPCTTSCGSGNESCSAGVWANCSARFPQTEVCNGTDDNCDGSIDEGLVRNCSNSCGNSGTETCASGSWANCNAAACPPPAPAAPSLTSPSNGFIQQVPLSVSGRITLDWSSVTGATTYEYLIRYSGSNGPGSVVAQSTTSNTQFSFSRQSSDYGLMFEWRVRAANANGLYGPWSETRRFFISHIVGDLLACTNSQCPSVNACYQVSSSITSGQVSGEPDHLILDYVSAACIRGRTCQSVNFSNIQGYSRSNRYNGCPP